MAAATLGCELHSYLLAVVLILGGIAALLVTGYVATRLAVKYLGAGAMAFFRGGRRSVGPTGPPAAARAWTKASRARRGRPARLQVRPSPRAVGPAVAPVPGHP